MVIFGGLELVVGGYFVHKHYKNKHAKRKLEEETQQRRHHTFPGAQPQSQHQAWHQPTQYQPPQHPVQPPHAPQYKYASQPYPQPYHQPPHTQSFNIPRRPVQQQQQQQQQQHPQQPLPEIIQPLQRADSNATLSRMPIANGYRPGGLNGPGPTLPPRPQFSSLSPIPQSPYSNSGFSVSTPALAASPTTPTTPIYGTGQHGGRQTIDDNWETYTAQGSLHYAPSVSTALGEQHDPDEPPPPYRP
jgi:hypothetical protein